MIEEFGLDEEAETETYKTISYYEYAKQIDDELSESDNHIAVITAEGTIMEGEITQGVAGANGVVKQIRSAHEMKILKPLYSGSTVQVDLLLPAK
jgi:protease-4